MKNLIDTRSLWLLSLTVCFAGCATQFNDTTGTANGQQDGRGADDGVPADNIRKVLDTCGGTARNPGAFPNQLVAGDGLHRYTLQAEDAICNDGTPAVLYVRAATDAAHENDWVFHLQGGSSCTTYEACEVRWCGSDFYDASKTSTTWAPMTVGARGIHNADSSLSSFAGWNQVYFYYCSSDSWQGRSQATITSEDGLKTFTLFRQGHTIIQRAFAELEGGITSDSNQQQLPSLASADRVRWTGTSAGSAGARNNADWVRDWFGPETEVSAVFDAAVTPSDDFVDPDLADAIAEFSQTRFALRIEQEALTPFVDESCESAVAGDELHRCNQAAFLLGNHITTPFFVRMDLRDSAALGNFRTLGTTTAQFAVDVRELLFALDNAQQDSAEGRTSPASPVCTGRTAVSTSAWKSIHGSSPPRSTRPTAVRPRSTTRSATGSPAKRCSSSTMSNLGFPTARPWTKNGSRADGSASQGLHSQPVVCRDRARPRPFGYDYAWL